MMNNLHQTNSEHESEQIAAQAHKQPDGNEAAPQSEARYDRTNDQMFKVYKHYKKRQPPPDYSGVVDFTNPQKYAQYVRRVDPSEMEGAVPDSQLCAVGLKPKKLWQVYELCACAGFLFVCDPFVSAGAQSFWAAQSLTSYTKESYPNNLDALMELDKTKSVWDISHEKTPDNSFIKQLRWTHLGYHFDYNTADYKAKKYHGFPQDLSQLTNTIAHAFGYSEYFPETGIINYYPDGASMGGHTDHYEEELCQPLISYSFGQACVFLIGGTTRDVKPTAIWLRSGDVILMTGVSRTCFHAVPTIVARATDTGPQDIPHCPLVVPSHQKQQANKINREQKQGNKKRKLPAKSAHDSSAIELKDAIIENNTTSISKPEDQPLIIHDINATYKEMSESADRCRCNGSDTTGTDGMGSIGHDVDRTDIVMGSAEEFTGVNRTADSGYHSVEQSTGDGGHVWTNCMRSKEEWLPFSKYLSSTRININIRQVHKYDPSRKHTAVAVTANGGGDKELSDGEQEPTKEVPC